MTKSLVRGGQLILHSVRMLKQVFVTLLRWGLVLMCIATIYFCCLKISLYHIKVLYWFYLADLGAKLGKYNNIVQIESPDGEPMALKVIDIITNPQLIWVKNYTIQAFLESLSLAAIITGISILILLWLFSKKGSNVSKDEEIRGQGLIDSDTLKKLIEHYNHKKKYKPYKLASIPYPAYTETMHTLITGSTGSGKTILISDLINQIKARGDKAIIYDKMGVYRERFFDKSKDVILNPFDKDSRPWNIFKEVSIAANFDAIASAFIPMEKGNNDPFWVRAARTIFAEVCSSLFEKQGVSNQELVDILLKKSLSEAAALVKGTAAQAIIDEQSPKTALSVMSMLATYLKCLKYLKDEGEVFSIRDWIMDDKMNGCVFLSSTGELHATLTPLISAWIEIATNSILSLNRSRDRKIWIILDELPSLHMLPSLQQGLAEVRQFGGCFVLSIQSISQLRDRYGHNGAQTLSSLCNNRVYLRAGDSDSARWYSENIGVTEIEEFREGLSYGAHEMRDGVSVNKQKITKHIVLSSEITGLNSKEGYFSMAEGFPIAKVSFEYKDWPTVNKKEVIEVKEESNSENNNSVFQTEVAFEDNHSLNHETANEITQKEEQLPKQDKKRKSRLLKQLIENQEIEDKDNE